ncbi:hypothetical protein [uncultured Tateyamaria sp.]|uniref:hypothetical protein n=1 Tax=uncultured Tateyamaria sp. TaxID=455651 RepID=UPI00260D2363|nr:hypothetical protein [uncultured Tateyamaria sp.]
MLTSIFSRLSVCPCLIAALLVTLVIAAPIVNAKGRPPRAVFLILPETQTPPRVDVQASALGGGRYLIKLQASDFMFTDLCVADAEAIPVGHAHVHVNGEKVASAYTPIVEIELSEPGTHVIDVVLRGQDHRPIIARDGLVQGQLHITVPG